MDLTPIRIRGKRKRKGQKNAVPASSRHAALSSSASSDRYNPYSGISLSKPASRPATAHQPSPSRQHKRTTLDQRFPVEILEKIFFYSRNLNLPRCSPVLGRSLSGRATLINLIIRAFGQTWNFPLRRDTSYPHQSCVYSSPDASRKSLGDAKFQTAVLECRWVTASLLLDAQEAWYRRNPDTQDFRHVLIYQRDTSLPQPVPVFTAQHVASQDKRLLEMHPPCAGHTIQHQRHSPYSNGTPASRPGAEADTNMAAASGKAGDLAPSPPPTSALPPLGRRVLSLPRFPCLHDCMEFDLAIMARREYLPEQLGSKASPRDQRQRYVSPFMASGYRLWLSHVHPLTSIPESLLLAGGPFSPELLSDRSALRKRLRHVVDLLFWLVRGGARLQSQDSWEVTLEGFKHLMEIDLRTHEEDLEEEREREEKGKQQQQKKGSDGDNDRDTKTVPKHTRGEHIHTPLSYSTDMLVVTIISLLGTLEVFQRQWPRFTHTTVWINIIRRRAKADPCFASSQTYALLYRMWTRYGTPGTVQPSDLVP